MRLQQLQENRENIRKIIKKHKGEAVWVFGSTVTADSDVKGDLDLLVRFRPDASLFDLINMRSEVESLVGVKVDIISEDGLKDDEIGRDIRKSIVDL